MITDQLLQSVGQACGLNTLKFDARGCARLLIDGTLSVQFEHNESDDLIYLYSPLGTIPLTGRENLFQQLLEANLFGHDTAGATLAIDKLHNDIILWQAVPVSATTPEDMVKAVEGFIAVAESWQQQMSDPSVSASAQTTTRRHSTTLSASTLHV